MHRGIAALHTGNLKEKYIHYHRSSDLPDKLDVKAAKKVLNMNIQAVVQRLQADLLAM
jgi:hypothetical protein